MARQECVSKCRLAPARTVSDFDPHHHWLGIPPDEQPVTHYRLLGLADLEANPDVIESAADRQMAHVRTFQIGPRAELCQRVLKELIICEAFRVYRSI